MLSVMIHYVKGDILAIPEKGLKVVAFPCGGDWPKQKGSVTKGVMDRWPGKMGPEGWHKACFRWMKINRDLGDVQWTCVDYKLAICAMVSVYTRHGINFEKLGECMEKLAVGAKALAQSQKDRATIHIPGVQERSDLEWVVKDYLDDFEVHIY